MCEFQLSSVQNNALKFWKIKKNNSIQILGKRILNEFRISKIVFINSTSSFLGTIRATIVGSCPIRICFLVRTCSLTTQQKYRVE